MHQGEDGKYYIICPPLLYRIFHGPANIFHKEFLSILRMPQRVSGEWPRASLRSMQTIMLQLASLTEANSLRIWEVKLG